jgi:hypothetical protein
MSMRVNSLARSRAGALVSGVVVSVVVVLATLGSPDSASAHIRSGTVAVDYRASVFSSHTPAYVASIVQSDRALGLAVRRGHVVVLRGYLGEPVFRLDPSGLWVNAASPTAVVDRLVKRANRVVAAGAHWRLISRRESVTWHDARVNGLPPGVSRGVWSVPLLVDGQPTHLRGELKRFPKPAIWPWLTGLAVMLVLAGMLVRRRHEDQLVRRAAAGAAVTASAAALVLLVGFALDTYASPGTWIEAVDGLAFIAVALWALFRGPEQWRMAGAIGAGLVSLAIGLLEGAVFFHPIVLAIVPAVVARLACVVAIGMGLDAAVLGAVFYAETDIAGLGDTLRHHGAASGLR